MFKIIPREEDKIRIYIAMSTSDKIPLRDDGRVDKTAFDPKEMLQKILQVRRRYYNDKMGTSVNRYTTQRARERFSPFHVEFTEVFWSTIFASKFNVPAGQNKVEICCSGPKGCLYLFAPEQDFHRWRCLPHSLSQGRAGC